MAQYAFNTAKNVSKVPSFFEGTEVFRPWIGSRKGVYASVEYYEKVRNVGGVVLTLNGNSDCASK